jgi:proline iminopeptidase
LKILKTTKVIFILCLLVSSVCSEAQNFIGRKKLNGTELFLSIQGKGETIIVLHGGPGLNHSYFKPHFDELEKKFRVVYYDQRASGQSATPSADSISMRYFVEDLEAIRSYLKLEKLDVLAHSWGAVLFANYAVTYPLRINKVMLVSPAMLSREYDQEAAANGKARAIAQDSVDRAEIMKKGNLQVTDYEKILKLSFKASAFDRNSMDRLNANLPGNFVEASRTLFTGLMKDPAASANLYDSLTRFNFPVLIVHGQADILPTTSIERMRKNLPLGSLMIFEKSGHFPFIEENKKFIALAIDYFRKK